MMERVPVLLLAISACDFYPEADELPPEEVDGCDPEITEPLPGGASEPAEAHNDTLGAQPTPYHVHYQWPGRDPSTSAGFLWRTDIDTLATVIEYGVGDELTERVEGASFLYGGDVGSKGDYRIHEVRLCGTLEPGTTYSYRVGGDGAWSPTYQFTTPGEPGSFDTFRVAIAGDSRGAYETWGTLLQQMDAHDPDFFLFSGDMVELGTNQEEWDSWFDATGEILARKALVPAHGNHEWLAANYFAQFALPENEEWFSILYGNLQLVVLNDWPRDAQEIETDQVSFMDAKFPEHPDFWKMAMHHQPIYSTCTRHGSYEYLRELWAPAFERNGVHAVFAGHNHIYERSVPIDEDREVATEEGVTYIVAGGAGAPLYEESKSEWFGLVANPVVHYLIADFGPNGVDVVVRDISDNVIDEFTLTKK